MSVFPQKDVDQLTSSELSWVQNGTAGNIELNEVTAPSGTASGRGIIYAKSSDSKLYYQNDSGVETDLTTSGAPTGSQYVVLALDGTLTAERVLTGTQNQVTITDGGAGGNVTLSLPQDINTSAQLRMGSAIINNFTLTLDATARISSFGATLVDDAAASNARTTLGLVIGTDVQAFDAQLADIAILSPSASAFIGSDASNLILRSAAQTRGDLGLIIGTNVQAWDAGLDDIAGLAVTDSNFIVGNGANWIAESGSDARTSLGVAIGVDVQAFSTSLLHLAGLGTAKGNLIIGSGTAHQTLLVGSNDQVLTADSTQPLGIKWAASVGGGSGTAEVHRWIDAADFALPDTAFAARSKYGTSWVNTILDFDSSSAEEAYFKVQIPNGASISTATLDLIWLCATGYASATSSSVVWDVGFRPVDIDEVMDASTTPGVATASLTTFTTANNDIAISSVALTQLKGTAVAGDLLQLLVKRQPANGEDNLAADAKLLGGMLRITP